MMQCLCTKARLEAVEIGVAIKAEQENDFAESCHAIKLLLPQFTQI